MIAQTNCPTCNRSKDPTEDYCARCQCAECSAFAGDDELCEACRNESDQCGCGEWERALPPISGGAQDADEPDARCPYCDGIMHQSEIADGCCTDCLYEMSEEQYERHERDRIKKLYPFLKHTKRMSVADLHDAERVQMAATR